MPKICYPGYSKVKFASLSAVLRYLESQFGCLFHHTLYTIVQCNKCYRDYLRQYGVQKLIDRLIKEAPQLNYQLAVLDGLCEWVEKMPIAQYDIQCYSIKDKVTILGHTFDGLDDIRANVEYYGSATYRELNCYPSETDHSQNDVHIGYFYDSYPTFDEYDVGDNRTYQNYIFRDTPITEEEMNESFKISHTFDFCMVHEHIPEDKLPLLYYPGSGRYMLLATKRE